MKRLLALFILIMALPIFAQEDTEDTIDCDSVPEIWQIQGDGDEANCLRNRVRLEDNIVTGIGPLGFFMQTPAERSDDNPYTSDGVYVLTGQPIIELQVGDAVNIDRGRVQEVYSTTMIDISNPRQVEIVSSGNPVPPPVDFFSIDFTDYGPASHPLERYEGMIVIAENATVTSPTNRFSEFGLTITNERAFRSMGVETDTIPELAGLGLPEWDLNPQLIEVDPPEMGLGEIATVPGTIVTVTGGVAYNYDDYQIFPTSIEIEAPEFNIRPVPLREDGEFTVATQNVENFFDLVNDPDREDDRFENYTPLNEEEYAIRLQKVADQIRVVLDAPDIVALQEIENTRTMTDLILQMHADDPSVRYTGCLLEGLEGRGIDVAYLVRVDNINVLDCYRMPGSYTEIFAGQQPLFTRPPLVLEAEYILPDGTAFPITLINNHIKSLSGIEQDDTQRKRELQAIRVAEFVQSILDEDPEAHVIVLGDLNAFQFSDGVVDVVGIISGTHTPEEALRAPEQDTLEPNLTNQVLNVPEDDRYSYNYNGTYQVLDHILTSPGLDPYITDRQFGRSNADAPAQWHLNPDVGPARSSDHDGFVIYIQPE